MRKRFGYVLSAALPVAVALCLAPLACSFYTACPPGNTNPPAGAGAGNPGSGGGQNDAGEGGSHNGTGGSDQAGGSAPLPTGKWVNATGNLKNSVVNGGDLSLLSVTPGSSRIIAGVGHAGLWASDDGGDTWTALGTGTGSDGINNVPTAIVYDPDDANTFWEVGIYGDAVFKSTDAGDAFTQQGKLQASDLVSIDFSDSKRRTLLAGTHEQTNVLWLSTDSGATWSDIGDRLPKNSNFSTLPLILDTKTFLVGSCGFASGACGIFRSVDGGANWTVASNLGPMARPLLASDGTMYWVRYQGGMLVSSDLGESWSLASDVPAQLFYSASPIELPDGRVLTLGRTYPIVSSDQGHTWQPVAGPLPFPGENCGTYSVVYSPELKALFVNHNDCSGNLTSDAIWTIPFDASSE